MGIFHERAIVTESGTTIGLRSRALLWPLCLAVVLGMFSNSLIAGAGPHTIQPTSADFPLTVQLQRREIVFIDPRTPAREQ